MSTPVCAVCKQRKCVGQPKRNAREMVSGTDFKKRESEECAGVWAEVDELRGDSTKRKNVKSKSKQGSTSVQR